VLQLANDIEKAKGDIAAAEKRQQEVLQLVKQAKHGKEDTVSSSWAKRHCRPDMLGMGRLADSVEPLQVAAVGQVEDIEQRCGMA
jgi:hypothetical protein